MKYLRIGDFSDVVGISVKTIRFYEEKGLIEPAYIDKYTGYRYYDEKNIEQVLMILQYKNMGFTLEEVKNINPNLLISKVESLKEQMSNIKRNIRHIESIIKKEKCNEMVFINDEKVIGKWELLKDEPFPFKELYFLPNGKEYWVFGWTNGYLKINDVYHPYEIVDNILVLSVIDVNGVIGKKVKFKKIDNKKYFIDEIKQVDDVNYEFINDEKVLGIWKTIAFTYSDNIAQIVKDIKDDLFLQRLIFCKDGKLIEDRINETILNHLLWTNSKELMLISATDGALQNKYIGEYLLKSIHETSHQIIYSLINNLKNYETDEPINKIKGIISLYNLIFEDGKMGVYHGDLIKYYLYLSRLQYEKDYDEDAFKSLDNALYHAKKLESLVVGKHFYSSILVKDVQYEIKEKNNAVKLLPDDWPWWNLPDCNELKSKIESDPRWAEWINKCK